MTGPSDADLVARAQRGDEVAFEALLHRHQAKLRAVVRRMVGAPADVDDLVQDSVLKAWSNLADFRGDAAFSTWLCAIGARAAVDHLRRAKRWRARAQVIYGNLCAENETLGGEVMSVIAQPDFAYDVKEHISYCLTCVGRTLDPEEQAALVLVEVSGMTAREAGKALNVSESQLRHRLSRARSAMQTTFDDLCALVGKTGVCYQCAGLRAAVAEERQGPPPPEPLSFDRRISMARAADTDAGASQAMHDLFWTRTAAIEAEGAGDADASSSCAPDGD